MNDERLSLSDERLNGSGGPSSYWLLLSSLFVSLAMHIGALVLFWAVARGAATSGWRTAGADVARAAATERSSILRLQVRLRRAGSMPSGNSNAKVANDPGQSTSATPRRGDPGGQGRISLPVPIYHPSEALTKQPQLADEIEDSIKSADMPIVGGRLLLRLYLSQTGRVDRVQVIQSNLPRDVEGVVVQNFYNARYLAGEIDGIPVMSEMTLFIELGA